MIEDELMSMGMLFLFAIIGSILASKLKQPTVIGLLLIGALIGPNAFNLVKEQHIIEMVAELGSILLLFVVGLEFVIPKLAKIGFKALMIGVLKIGINFFITYEVGIILGIGQVASLIFGIMLSVSSTVVIVKVLESKGLYHREEMPLLVGVLIFEDIFAVIVMTFLSGAGQGTSMIRAVENLIISMTIMVVAYVLSLKIMPYIINFILKEGDEEIVIFIDLGICAGFAYLAIWLGLTPAIGAFLAGSIVASLPQVKQFEHAIKPYSLTFSSLFFISIGTMVNFASLAGNITLLIVMLVVVLVTRFLSVGLVSYLFANFKRSQVIFSSITMFSVGEFSLLIAQSAAKLVPGLDLVSIASFLIFTTAIIMAIAVSYYQHMTEMFSHPSSGFQPRSFSAFMRSFSEEMDTENTNSNMLKVKSANAFVFGLLLMFFLIGARRFLLYSANNFEPIALYSIGAATFVILVFLMVKVFMSIKEVKTYLIKIISSLTPGSNESKARYILDNLFLALIFLLITVSSPILIVVFKLPNWINLISFALLVLVYLRFRKVFSIVHNTVKHFHIAPSYKKVNQLKF
ncbi:MAG: cation:proton antiporter [Nanoarchaeota archaeon]|nr:cation:proton antiporter [Nanoarchaeota archaeon]